MTKRVAKNMGGFVVEEFNEKLSTVVDERGLTTVTPLMILAELIN